MRALALLLLMLPAGLAAQPSARRIEVLAGNYHTSIPVKGVLPLFYQTFHPGIQLGYERELYQHGRHAWLLRGQAGFFYHRFIQAGVPVKVEGVYEIGLAGGFRWAFEAGLGAGYLHSFVLTDTYQLQADGSYERVYRYGRPQATVSLTPGISYAFGHRHAYRMLLRYQVALQLPFVSGFVPVLPYNILQLGLSYRLPHAQAQNPSTP